MCDVGLLAAGRPASAMHLFTDRYDANFCAKIFSRALQISENAFASRAPILLSHSCCLLLCAKQVFERRNITRRTGLVRVLYLMLAGRGRMPRKTWPIVNWSCGHTISVFDPPTYVVASLKKPVRVSGKLAYARSGRPLPPSRVSPKSSKQAARLLGTRS